jgi:hypothetical protein
MERSRLADNIPARLTAAEGRRFGVSVGLAFLALAGVAWWRGRGHASVALATIGGLLVVGGVALPTYLGPVFRAWMGLAGVMSRFTTPLMLGLVFYLVVTPVALLMRLVGASPLRRPGAGASGWVARAPGRAGGRDMERQF